MNIRVTFPGGQTRDYPTGTLMSEVAADPAFPRTQLPTVAALHNNEVISLQQRLSVNCAVSPVALGSRPATVIYRRSLSFLLAMAVTRSFPKRRLIVAHSLGQGYFYYFDALDKVTPDDLGKIRNEMTNGTSQLSRPNRATRFQGTMVASNGQSIPRRRPAA